MLTAAEAIHSRRVIDTMQSGTLPPNAERLLVCRLCAPYKAFPFGAVPRQRCGAFELRTRLLQPAELLEKVSPDGGQQMVPLERPTRRQRVDQLETRRRAERHCHCHGTI